jgi:hypothetical protein
MRMGHLIIILSGKRICYELGGMKNENFTFRVKLNKNALLTKIHFVKREEYAISYEFIFKCL